MWTTKLVIIVELCIGLIALGACSKNDNSDFKELEREFERKPKDCFVVKQLAYTYQNQHQYKDAISTFNKAIVNCGNEPMLMFQLGVTHIITGNEKEGIKYTDQAIRNAERIKDLKLAEVLRKERLFWLEKSNGMVNKKLKVKNEKNTRN